MNCEKNLEYIIRKMDGDLNNFEETLLEEHLASCTHCLLEAQGIMQDQDDIIAHFKDVPELNSSFTQTVMSKVSKSKRRSLWNSQLFKVASLAILLGGISLIVYAGHLFISNDNPSPIASKEPNSQVAKIVKESTPEESGKIVLSDNPPVPPKQSQQSVAAIPEEVGDNSRAIPDNEMRALAKAPEEVRSLVQSLQKNAEESPFPTIEYLPPGYQLVDKSVDKDPEGRVVGIHLYYLPQDYQSDSGSLPLAYISVFLQVSDGQGEELQSVFVNSEGEKEIRRSLSYKGQKINVLLKSKGVEEDELAKLLKIEQ